MDCDSLLKCPICGTAASNDYVKSNFLKLEVDLVSLLFECELCGSKKMQMKIRKYKGQTYLYWCHEIDNINYFIAPVKVGGIEDPKKRSRDLTCKDPLTVDE